MMPELSSLHLMDRNMGLHVQICTLDTLRKQMFDSHTNILDAFHLLGTYLTLIC